MTMKLPLAALTVTVLALGGEFRTAFNKAETVTLAIPRPAEAVLAVKTISLKVGPSQAPPNRLLQLDQLIQQDLSRQFEISDGKPDAALKFSVISYEPVTITNQTITEMRSINVGNDKTPNYQSRSVPVVYELIHGSVTIGAAVVDASGRTLDTFNQNELIAERKELTVNGQASTQTATSSAASPSKSAIPDSLGAVIGFKPHFSTRQPAQRQRPVVETSDSIELAMLQKLAAKVQHRYVATTEPVEIALAVDPELRLGDKLAESGQWGEALDSWTKASMKKNPSDRLYNMAVAKEALAYAEYARDNDMETFLPKFQGTMDLYTEALHGDPNEKYMRESVDRLRLAKVNIETARRMKVDQDTASEQAVAAATEKARRQKLREAALQDHHPDSRDEGSFRLNVRTQLAETTGDVSDAQRDQLIAFGKRLKLTELQSYRVVAQEIQRKSDMREALADYERVFRPLAADGRITGAERAQLRDLAAKEGLDPSDVKSVEDKYHFTEGSSGPSARPAKSAGSAARANQ